MKTCESWIFNVSLFCTNGRKMLSLQRIWTLKGITMVHVSRQQVLEGLWSLWCIELADLSRNNAVCFGIIYLPDKYADIILRIPVWGNWRNARSHCYVTADLNKSRAKKIVATCSLICITLQRTENEFNVKKTVF